jgi:hypothetical protein
MRSWKFQRVLPVLWSEYRVQLSGIYNHVAVLHNVTDSLRINQKMEGVCDLEAGTIGYARQNESDPHSCDYRKIRNDQYTSH